MVEVGGRLRVVIDIYDLWGWCLLVILGRRWLLVVLRLIINSITAVVGLARVIVGLLEVIRLSHDICI
jgi:hypothetical protein